MKKWHHDLTLFCKGGMVPEFFTLELLGLSQLAKQFIFVPCQFIRKEATTLQKLSLRRLKLSFQHPKEALRNPKRLLTFCKLIIRGSIFDSREIFLVKLIGIVGPYAKLLRVSIFWSLFYTVTYPWLWYASEFRVILRLLLKWFLSWFQPILPR